MTLNTTGYNLEASINKIMRAIIASIQSDINSALSKSYVISYHPNQAVRPGHSVQTQYITGGYDPSRRRFYDVLQIDVRAQDANPSERRRLALLIRDSISEAIGLTTKRNALYAYLEVKDYFSNSSSPSHAQNARIELFGQESWLELPDEDNDPTVLRFSIDFQIFSKK